MNLFLCSHFSKVGALLKDHIAGKKVVFIPTASIHEGYTGYVGSARTLFKKLGAELIEIEISTANVSDITQVFDAADIIKDNKAIYDEWNNKALFKDSFYNSHKEEIDKYKRARAILEKITGSSAIKSKDW